MTLSQRQGWTGELVSLLLVHCRLARAGAGREEFSTAAEQLASKLADLRSKLEGAEGDTLTRYLAMFKEIAPPVSAVDFILSLKLGQALLAFIDQLPTKLQN